MNVLLVDDQWLVLEEMRKSIRWNAIGVENLYTAQSAEEAKMAAERLKPDILITDIEMPGETGMQLANWFSVHYPEIPVIFLTAHADFSYAREAIKNGGFDYILQPARAEEVEEVIKRCREHLEEEKQKKQLLEKGRIYDQSHEKVLEGLLNTAFTNMEENPHWQRVWNEESGNREGLYGYIPALFVVEACENQDLRAVMEECIQEKYSHISTEVWDVGSFQQMGMVFPYEKGSMMREEWSVNLKQLYEEVKEQWNGAVMCYTCRETGNDLGFLIEQIKAVRDDNLFMKPGIFYVRERNYGIQLRNPDKNQWKQWLLQGDGELIVNQIRNLLEYAENEKQLSMQYMKMLYETFTDVWIVCCYLKNIDRRACFSETYPYERFQSAYRTVSDICEAVMNVTRGFHQILKKEEEKDQTCDPKERIRNLCIYIRDNLDRNISRSEAAAMLYLSEDYFSKLFKQETGYGFKEYVLEQKIEYCKRLLKETRYPVSVIAGKIGYDNFSNFSQIFKKYTGMTPQEWRTMQVK